MAFSEDKIYPLFGIYPFLLFEKLKENILQNQLKLMKFVDENSPKKIEFNLSHSGEMALLAIGQEHPLGVDVEYFSKRPYIGIAQQLFSEIEMRAMKNVPSFMEPMIFFHIWAQKEAFIKASGLGLSYPTQRFDVQAYPQTHQAIHDPMLHHDWHMVSFMPEIACCAALCHHPCIEQMNYFKI